MTATLEETRAAVREWFRRYSRCSPVPRAAALELEAILDAAPCDDPEERRARYESAISKPETP